MSKALELLLMILFCCGLPAKVKAQHLNELLQRAIEKSPDVNKAMSDMIAARADLNGTQAAWLPQASIRLYNGVGETQQSNPLLSQRNGSDKIQNNGFSIQQNIYNKPASVQLEQSRLTVQQTQLHYAAAVQIAINAWMRKLIELKQNDAAIKLAQVRLDTAFTQREYLNSGNENGERSELELVNAEAEQELREAELFEATQNFEQTLWELTQLTGQVIDLGWISDIEFAQLPSTINETDLVQHIAIKNLNLQIQSLKNKAAELEIDKAIGQHLPNLKLIAQHTQSRSETASTLGNQVKQNVMALQLEVPLFSGFATQAQTEKAIAGLSRQQAEYENASNEAKQKVRAALKQLKAISLLGKAHTRAIQATTRELKAAEIGLQHRLITQLELAKIREKLAELKLKNTIGILSANKTYLAIQELSGELSIENACSRLTPRKETTRAQP